MLARTEEMSMHSFLEEKGICMSGDSSTCTTIHLVWRGQPPLVKGLTPPDYDSSIAIVCPKIKL